MTIPLPAAPWFAAPVLAFLDLNVIVSAPERGTKLAASAAPATTTATVRGSTENILGGVRSQPSGNKLTLHCIVPWLSTTPQNECHHCKLACPINSCGIACISAATSEYLHNALHEATPDTYPTNAAKSIVHMMCGGVCTYVAPPSLLRG